MNLVIGFTFLCFFGRCYAYPMGASIPQYACAAMLPEHNGQIRRSVDFEVTTDKRSYTDGSKLTGTCNLYSPSVPIWQWSPALRGFSYMAGVSNPPGRIDKSERAGRPHQLKTR